MSSKYIVTACLVIALLAVCALLLFYYFRNNKESSNHNNQPKEQINKPSVEESYPIKGINKQSLCPFANSLLQCLFSIDTFRDYFLKKEKLGIIPQSLTRIFEKLDKSNDTSVDIEENLQMLLLELKKRTGFGTQDFNSLMYLYKAIISSLITDYYEYESNRRFTYLNRDKWFEHLGAKDDYFMNNFLLELHRSRETLYKLFYELEKNPNCKLVDIGNKKPSSLKINNVISILIPEKDQSIIEVEVPKEIDIKGKKYLLRSFIVNESTTQDEKHYSACILKGDNLYKADDSTITKSSFIDNAECVCLLIYIMSRHTDDKQKGQPKAQPKAQSKAQSDVDKDIPIKGIRNQSASCYANSLFQCLNSINTFRKYFLSHDRKGEVREAMTTIIKKLNQPGNEILKIKKYADQILKEADEKLGFSTSGYNRLTEFYKFVMSRCISEEYADPPNTIIDVNDEWFSRVKEHKNNYFVKYFLLRTIDRNKKRSETRYQLVFYLFLDSGDLKDRGPEIALNMPLSGKNRVLVIDNGRYFGTRQFKVPKNIFVGEKKYILRSFIVGGNRKANTGHYYAHILKEDVLYKANDSIITKEPFTDNANFENVAMLFYEIQHNK